MVDLVKSFKYKRDVPLRYSASRVPHLDRDLSGFLGGKGEDDFPPGWGVLDGVLDEIAQDQDQQVAQRDRDRRADHRQDQRRVGGDPAQHLAGHDAFVERGAHPDHPVEHRLADVGHDTLAEAAKIARDNAILIHVVGVGDPSSTGEEVLDEEALEAVAETTGGRYFFAQDRDQLAEIYDELDRIGTRDIEAETYRPRLDLFHWPLAALLVLSLIFHTGLLLRHVVRRRGHAHG